MFNIKLKIIVFFFSVTYVKIFFNKFLHLLLNRCDVKLNPVLIYGSVFTSLGSGFMHLPEHFLVVVVIFPWLLTLTPLKNGVSYSSRCYQVNLKSLPHNLSIR